ncbi:hypothetical protein HMPREF9072_00696, partial [Capnocytophaga sp. oral taxon 324 str. F0483]
FFSALFRSSPLSFELLNPPHFLIFSFPNLLIFSLPVWLTLPVRLAPLAKLILSANTFLVARAPFSHFLIF